MIVGPNGQPVASDGPTGREIHLVEVIKEGKSSWALAPVGGGFEKLEVVQVLTLTAHYISAQVRGEMAHQRTMNDVKAKMDSLKEK